MELSIVVVEYNGLEELRACIDSVLQHITPIEHELIVVSNSCYSSQAQSRIRKEFPNCAWSFTQRNLGYSGAANLGLRQASGRYVLLLNPDARLLQCEFLDWIRYMDRHPEVGVMGPKIIDTRGNVQDSCRRFPTPFSIMLRILGRLVFRSPDGRTESHRHDHIQAVDWVSGACMLVRGTAMAHVGMFDEEFFLYVEDVDWCRRFWSRGLRVEYWPTAIVEHSGRRLSSRGLSRLWRDRYVRIHAQAYWYYFLKHGLGASSIRSKTS